MYQKMLKGGLLKELYYILKVRKDTLSLIPTIENRLFKYNTVKCGVGEKEFRLKLMDDLIVLYSNKKELKKANGLVKIKYTYELENKLKTPIYIH